MKKNRIISLFLAVVICVACLPVCAFADEDEYNYTDGERASVIQAISDAYTQATASGEFNVDTFNSVMSKLLPQLSLNVVGVTDIAHILNLYGIDTDKFWAEYYQTHGGGGHGGHREFDMHGFGACCKRNTGHIESYYEEAVFCDYIVIKYNADNQLVYGCHGDISTMWGDGHMTSGGSSGAVSPRYTFYGDIRYDDGTPADDKITDNPIVIPPLDEGGDDLDGFLQQLLAQLKLLYPDLSTVNGLLAAIYAECQSINSKVDGTQGSGGGSLTENDINNLSELVDNALASTAIGGAGNNSELMKLLIKMRKDIQALKDGDETMKLESGLDMIIDPETGEILGGVVDGIMDNIGQINNISGLDLDIPSVVDLSEIGSYGIAMLSGFCSLLVSLSYIIDITAISGLMMSLQGIFLDNSSPADLTFNFQGNSYVLLSSSTLTSWSGVLVVIKSFVSIIILYCWLKWARKMVLSFVG